MPPLVSAVVVAHQSASHLRRLLPALRNQVDEIVVVDNSSTDGSATVAERLGARCVRLASNRGFAAGVNPGVEAARGSLLLLINPDVVVTPGCVRVLVDAASRHPGDVVGPVVRKSDGSLQLTRIGPPSLWTLLGEQVLTPESAPAGEWPWRVWHRYRSYRLETPGPLLSGVCLLVPRATWERVGALDEEYFLYWEEVDWQVRARRLGVRTWLVPSAEVIHSRAGSTGLDDPSRARAYSRSARRFVCSHLRPRWRATAGLALLWLGQILRVAAWSARTGSRADRRRIRHLAAARGLRQRSSPKVWMVEEFGRGGIARYAVDVADLLEPGSNVVIATNRAGPAPGGTRPFVRWFASSPHDPPMKAALAGATGLLQAARNVRRGDVVWVPLGIRPSFELVLVAILRCRGARLAATIHNRAPHDRNRGEGLVVRAARMTHAAVVHTAALQEWAAENGLPGVRLPFPPPRPEVEAVSVLGREGLGIPADAVVVAMVGTLRPYKGVTVLLDAFAELERRDPRTPVWLVIAGQADRESPQAMATARGLRRVTVHEGYLPDGRLLDVLLAADAVALPYQRVDNSGVGALAADLGCPVLASDLPALRDLFADNAVYAPPGDVAAWAQVLSEVSPNTVMSGSVDRQQSSAILAERYRTFVRQLTLPQDLGRLDRR